MIAWGSNQRGRKTGKTGMKGGLGGGYLGVMVVEVQPNGGRRSLKARSLEREGFTISTNNS